MIMARKREGIVRCVIEAAVAKTIQKKAVLIQRMEGGKKTDRIESPAAIREKRIKKSKGRSAS
jgi:hypothetical protein